MELPPEYVALILEREAKAARTKKAIYGRREPWRAYLWSTYRLTIEEYDQRVLDQRGRCAICQRQRDLDVDHCHQQGHVRGLLCARCNSALGLLGDSVDALTAVLMYLLEADANAQIHTVSEI